LPRHDGGSSTHQKESTQKTNLNEIEGKIEALLAICRVLATFAFEGDATVRAKVRSALEETRGTKFVQTSRTFRRAFQKTIDDALRDLSATDR